MKDYETQQELKMDMEQEMKEEAYYERKMYEDEEFAVEQYSEQIMDIQEKLSKIARELNEYGHQLTVEELLKYV